MYLPFSTTSIDTGPFICESTCAAGSNRVTRRRTQPCKPRKSNGPTTPSIRGGDARMFHQRATTAAPKRFADSKTITGKELWGTSIRKGAEMEVTVRDDMVVVLRECLWDLDGIQARFIEQCHL